jgi:hypothetical protein
MKMLQNLSSLIVLQSAQQIAHTIHQGHTKNPSILSQIQDSHNIRRSRQNFELGRWQYLGGYF